MNPVIADLIGKSPDVIDDNLLQSVYTQRVKNWEGYFNKWAKISEENPENSDDQDCFYLSDEEDWNWNQEVEDVQSGSEEDGELTLNESQIQNSESNSQQDSADVSDRTFSEADDTGSRTDSISDLDLVEANESSSHGTSFELNQSQLKRFLAKSTGPQYMITRQNYFESNSSGSKQNSDESNGIPSERNSDESIDSNARSYSKNWRDAQSTDGDVTCETLLCDRCTKNTNLPPEWLNRRNSLIDSPNHFCNNCIYILSGHNDCMVPMCRTCIAIAEEVDERAIAVRKLFASNASFDQSFASAANCSSLSFEPRFSQLNLSNPNVSSMRCDFADITLSSLAGKTRSTCQTIQSPKRRENESNPGKIAKAKTRQLISSSHRQPESPMLMSQIVEVENRKTPKTQPRKIREKLEVPQQIPSKKKESSKEANPKPAPMARTKVHLLSNKVQPCAEHDNKMLRVTLKKLNASFVEKQMKKMTAATPTTTTEEMNSRFRFKVNKITKLGSEKSSRQTVTRSSRKSNSVKKQETDQSNAEVTSQNKLRSRLKLIQHETPQDVQLSTPDCNNRPNYEKRQVKTTLLVDKVNMSKHVQPRVKISHLETPTRQKLRTRDEELFTSPESEMGTEVSPNKLKPRYKLVKSETPTRRLLYTREGELASPDSANGSCYERKQNNKQKIDVTNSPSKLQSRFKFLVHSETPTRQKNFTTDEEFSSSDCTSGLNYEKRKEINSPHKVRMIQTRAPTRQVVKTYKELLGPSRNGQFLKSCQNSSPTKLQLVQVEEQFSSSDEAECFAYKKSIGVHTPRLRIGATTHTPSSRKPNHRVEESSGANCTFYEKKKQQLKNPMDHQSPQRVHWSRIDNATNRSSVSRKETDVSQVDSLSEDSTWENFLEMEKNSNKSSTSTYKINNRSVNGRQRNYSQEKLEHSRRNSIANIETEKSGRRKEVCFHNHDSPLTEESAEIDEPPKSESTLYRMVSWSPRKVPEQNSIREESTFTASHSNTTERRATSMLQTSSHSNRKSRSNSPQKVSRSRMELSRAEKNFSPDCSGASDSSKFQWVAIPGPKERQPIYIIDQSREGEIINSPKRQFNNSSSNESQLSLKKRRLGFGLYALYPPPPPIRRNYIFEC